MMKTKYITLGIILLFTVIIFSSCSDDYFDTQPDNLLTEEEIFQNRGQTERWWAGLFSEIPDIWDQPYAFYYSTTSDESDVSNWSNPSINSGSLAATNVPFNHGPYYEKIRLATIFLANIDNNQEIKDLANGDILIEQYKGEAQFLRAYYYWILMKHLGPVVIAPLEVLEPDTQFQKPRSTWDECVEFVMNEMNEAKAKLPEEYFVGNSQNVDGTQVGRINKMIVSAVQSQVLLFSASPLYNGNSEFSDFRNFDGTQLLNSSYDNNKWQLAAEMTKEAIDFAESNGKALFKVENADPFRAAYLSTRNVFWDGWDVEGIWIRPSSSNGQWEFSASPRCIAGTPYNGIAAVQRLVDDYRMSDGQKINESPDYSETGFTSTANEYYDSGTFNMYVNREPRLYAYINFNGSVTPGNPKSGAANQRVEFFNTGNSGKAGAPRDWPKTGYTARKNIHPTFSANPRVNVSRPAMIIRLSELYLSYAEAMNEAQPGNPAIEEYLNRVRNRAGLPDIETGLSKDRMRDEIRLERRLELCFEGHRFFDVRRWKVADQPNYAQGGDFFGMNIEKGTTLSDEEFHTRTKAFSRATWQRKFYFMPYRQNEVDRNLELVQFPGY